MRFAAVAGAILGLAAFSVQAAEMPENTGAYWTDPSGHIWRDMNGNCWRSIHWSKETANRECDPELFAKKPEEKMETKVERTTLQAEALFDFDKATIKPEGETALDNLAQKIESYHNVESIRVTGYTDRIGTESYNDALSLRRAKAVADYLKAKPMLSSYDFQVRGLGERDPVVACTGIRGKALIQCLAPNRRVVVDVAVTRKVTVQE